MRVDACRIMKKCTSLKERKTGNNLCDNATIDKTGQMVYNEMILDMYFNGILHSPVLYILIYIFR